MRTIRSSQEFDEIFRESKRVSHPLVIALIRKTPPQRGPGGRVAFVAGKKLGGAVLRNRSRRVLREAARLAGAPWDGMDVVLIARSATASAPPDRLREAMARLAPYPTGEGWR